MEAAKKVLLRRVLVIVVVLACLAFVVYGLLKSQASNEQPTQLQGQMQWEQTNVAAKVPGRLAAILVDEGERVTMGQPLIDMDSPEIDAKIEQAEAAKQAAVSQLDKANNGARPQEIAQAQAAVTGKQAASNLAQSTYERTDRLYQEGLMSRQKRDEAYTKYIAAQQELEAARQQYDLAVMGTRDEDIAAAEAQVAQADGKLQEALSAKQESNLVSPVAGVVDEVIVNAGEVIGQGSPILSVVDADKQWVTLNVTETYLSQFGIGQTFVGQIPALSTANAPYQQTFKVYASSPLADFATWRPTNTDDGFDVRTFAIKARPLQPDPKVRSGMSVLVTVDAPAVES